MAFDFALILPWLELAVRWLHIITAIAWIGSSFYFIALDLGLWKRDDLPKGVYGEEWQVHGGGFYHVQKYMVAPEHMPNHLVWFKWESYSTWMSGFVLLCLLYYLNADIYMIDTSVLEMPVWVAIAISIGSIVGFWFLYNGLCYSKLADHPTMFMVLLYAMIVVLAWGFFQVFSGRAAMLHLGAVTATIMSANVFLVIIPNQKIVVADLIAGRTPDAKYGKTAKLRSIHNNYLTLPVIFLMMSNHYPLAFATEYAWVIASLVFLIGVSIRHYFNTRNARQGEPNWTWAVTAVLFAIIVALSYLGSNRALEAEETELSEKQEILMASADFEEVYYTVVGRCAVCHAAEPLWPRITWAPKDVVLETEAEVAFAAQSIYIHSGLSHAMPPGNITWMEPQERELIVRWYQNAMQESAAAGL